MQKVVISPPSYPLQYSFITRALTLLLKHFHVGLGAIWLKIFRGHKTDTITYPPVLYVHCTLYINPFFKIAQQHPDKTEDSDKIKIIHPSIYPLLAICQPIISYLFEQSILGIQFLKVCQYSVNIVSQEELKIFVKMVI